MAHGRHARTGDLSWRLPTRRRRWPDRAFALVPHLLILAARILTALMWASVPASAQNIRGSATGPTTAKGCDHPDRYLHLQDGKPADNMYPVMQHPDWDKEARDKLAALEKKTGKKPNILIFLLEGNAGGPTAGRILFPPTAPRREKPGDTNETKAIYS